MPRLSIVIPCSGSPLDFEDTLVSVLQNRPADCEVLVVQSREYEDPYALGDEVRFLTAPSDELLELVRWGVDHAAAPFVHVLHCGLEVAGGWADDVDEWFADPRIGAVAPVWLERPDDKRLVAAGVARGFGAGRRIQGRGIARRAHSRLARQRILGPTWAVGFFRRQAWDEVNGCDTQLGLPWCDLGIGRALARNGWLARVAAESLVSGQPLPKEARGFQAGRAASRFYRREDGQDITWLRRWLVPLRAVSDAVREGHPLRMLTYLCGRLAGWLEPRAPVEDFKIDGVPSVPVSVRNQLDNDSPQQRRAA